MLTAVGGPHDSVRKLVAGLSGLLSFGLCATVVSGQTYSPKPGSSPLVLLEAPKDSKAYYDSKARAKQLVEVGKLAEAQALMEQRARDYPRDPENWRLLAGLRSATGDHTGAAEAYETAGTLWGWGIGQANGYMAAASHLAAGNRRKALDRLRWLIEEQHGFYRASLYNWPEFAALKEDPEFLTLIGRVDAGGWTRERGWLHDIDLLHDEVKRVNPDYRDAPFPAAFTRAYAQLKANVPKLSDEEIFVGMQRMLATLRQGHLVLWADDSATTPNRYLPLRLYAFPQGLFVIDASDAHRELIGFRVVAIGGVPADEALRRFAGSMSVDGEMQYLWGASRLAETYYLKGIGATPATDRVQLTVTGPAGERRVSLPTVAKEMPGRQDKLIAPRGVIAPLFLTDVNIAFREQLLPAHDALYVQINNLRDGKDETLDAYGQRLWTMIEKDKPTALILDLRHNNGGTTQLYPNLLRTIVAFSRVPGNQVYALIGRRTYSAAGNFITDLERLADPVFVGEASSECCNLYGDPTYVRLPYSKVQGELTAVKWQLSEPGDRRREISPHVPVQLTADAYFAGRDPALETLLRIISDQQKNRTTSNR